MCCTFDMFVAMAAIQHRRTMQLLVMPCRHAGPPSAGGSAVGLKLHDHTVERYCHTQRTADVAQQTASSQESGTKVLFSGVWSRTAAPRCAVPHVVQLVFSTQRHQAKTLTAMSHMTHAVSPTGDQAVRRCSGPHGDAPLPLRFNHTHSQLPAQGNACPAPSHQALAHPGSIMPGFLRNTFGCSVCSCTSLGLCGRTRPHLSLSTDRRNRPSGPHCTDPPSSPVISSFRHVSPAQPACPPASPSPSCPLPLPREPLPQPPLLVGAEPNERQVVRHRAVPVEGRGTPEGRERALMRHQGRVERGGKCN